MTDRSPCDHPDPDGPMLVTGGCADPLYGRPVIERDVSTDVPIPLRQVTGRFEGTDGRFNVYLPDAGWEGRFFQLAYPLTDERATDEAIAFAAASGAYVVQSNDPGGYRIDAAAAKLSREIAAGHYGASSRIFGYLYGASGGGYQTIGALENTVGVWDGGVPMVIGVPTSIPSNFFIRAFARFFLAGKAEAIAEAVRPGGSGDPYASLDDAEASVLREVTTMGLPLRAWEDPDYLLGLEDPQRLMGFAETVRLMDPTYAEDFWTQDGYLGTEQSALGERLRAARTAENEWELALLTHFRHQVPSRGGYPPSEQHLGPDGHPRYPQRPLEIGPVIAGHVCGTGAHPTHTGALRAKTILIQNLLDPDALPADGDWYRAQVEAALGDEHQDRFRIWLNDHADHHPGPVDPRRSHRLVAYDGILQQALRDLSAWVERNAQAPESTRYQVASGQVVVEAAAADRHGVQPVVEVAVDGRPGATIGTGEHVGLRAVAEVPHGGGVIVAGQWELGDGTVLPIDIGPPRDQLVAEQQVSYGVSGEYFAGFRVTAQRREAIGSPFARLQNLGRVAVRVR